MDAKTILFLLVALVVGFLLRSFLPAYFSKKGENLATKEDIAAITNEIKRVESFYAKELTRLEHRQQLRMAAVDKRLEAHQQAYMLWRKLQSNVNSKDINSIAIECQEWWDRNCLYLAPEAREAFLLAYIAAADHHNLLKLDGVTGAVVRANSQVIKKAGAVIVSGVELPTLGELEVKDVTDKDAT